jgi:hypothetical protein
MFVKNIWLWHLDSDDVQLYNDDSYLAIGVD